MRALEIDIPRKARDVLLPTQTPSGKRVRYRCLYGGRDGAKSHSIARFLLARGIAKKERILCVREVQNSIADSVHKLLSDLVVSMDLGAYYTVQKTAVIGVNGTEFSFHGLSSETRDSLKSKEGTTICWVEEAHTISKRSWEILEPTIRAIDSEIIVSFNPDMDTDETYVRFVVSPPEDGLVAHISWEDNKWRSVVLDTARERMRREAPEDYANIYGGKPRTAVEGAIYKNEINALVESNRIRPVPYDPMLRVHTIWDLGWNDQTTIVFAQRLGGEVRIIDYYEKSFSTYADDVAMLEKKGYRYGQDWLPHDGAAHLKAADGKSPEEILRALGRKVEIINIHDPEIGIKNARLMFPRCYFDKDKTQRLVDCLKRYRRRINQVTNEPEGPLHDEHSHGADAFRGLAMVVDKLKNDVSEMKKIKYPSPGESIR